MRVVSIYSHRFAKRRAVISATRLAGQSLGLSRIQCESMADLAGKEYADGSRSPARVVSDIRRQMVELVSA